MRRPNPEDALARFLAAESARPEGEERAAELDEAAEEALFALFTALPALAPPAGFAERTLARAGVGAIGAAVARRRRWAPWQRGLALAALVGIAWATAWAPAVLRALGQLISPVGLINAANSAATALILAAGELLGFGQRMLVLGQIVSDPFRTPTAAWVGAACLATSWLAFRSLRDLLSRQRSWGHVEPV